MKFPWQRRADEEQRLRIQAEQRLAEVRADWPEVERHAAALRYEKELNGWTDAIVTIFGSPKAKGS